MYWQYNWSNVFGHKVLEMEAKMFQRNYYMIILQWVTMSMTYVLCRTVLHTLEYMFVNKMTSINSVRKLQRELNKMASWHHPKKFICWFSWLRFCNEGLQSNNDPHFTCYTVDDILLHKKIKYLHMKLSHMVEMTWRHHHW